MGRKLYVGNLSYNVTDGELAKMFEAHGTVVSGAGYHGPTPVDPKASALWKWVPTRKRRRRSLP